MNIWHLPIIKREYLIIYEIQKNIVMLCQNQLFLYGSCLSMYHAWHWVGKLDVENAAECKKSSSYGFTSSIRKLCNFYMEWNVMMWQQRLIFNQIIILVAICNQYSVYCHPPISFLNLFVFIKLSNHKEPQWIVF